MVGGLKEDAADDMPRQKIVLRRRVTSQRVKLPNGQSFLARYGRGRNLARNVTVRKTRGIGRRKRRKTQNDGSLLRTIARVGTKALTSSGLLKKRLSAGPKAINSDIGKKLADKGIKHAPELYRLGKSKIKNKNVRKALESEVANYVVHEAQKKSSRKRRELIWLKK